jgi:hypothetical protein
MPDEHVWLDVPFAEKDEAKRLGARWDSQTRRWFAPQAGMPELGKWTASADIPDVLGGEDRTLGQGLFVDLVPSSCWFTNVRSCVASKDWERLRRMITRRAKQRCEICGAAADRDRKRWLEAHERWIYDDATCVQTLKRLICLCTDCHHATHYGYSSQVLGIGEETFAHLVKVTKMTQDQASNHIDEAFTLWRQRSLTAWRLDLSMLTNAGIALAPRPNADERIHVAEHRLQS